MEYKLYIKWIPCALCNCINCIICKSAYHYLWRPYALRFFLDMHLFFCNSLPSTKLINGNELSCKPQHFPELTSNDKWIQTFWRFSCTKFVSKWAIFTSSSSDFFETAFFDFSYFVSVSSHSQFTYGERCTRKWHIYLCQLATLKFLLFNFANEKKSNNKIRTKYQNRYQMKCHRKTNGINFFLSFFHSFSLTEIGEEKRKKKRSVWSHGSCACFMRIVHYYYIVIIHLSYGDIYVPRDWGNKDSNVKYLHALSGFMVSEARAIRKKLRHVFRLDQ